MWWEMARPFKDYDRRPPLANGTVQSATSLAPPWPTFQPHSHATASLAQRISGVQRRNLLAYHHVPPQPSAACHLLRSRIAAMHEYCYDCLQSPPHQLTHCSHLVVYATVALHAGLARAALSQPLRSKLIQRNHQRSESKRGKTHRYHHDVCPQKPRLCHVQHVERCHGDICVRLCHMSSLTAESHTSFYTRCTLR